jgi:hypothetical protein
MRKFHYQEELAGNPANLNPITLASGRFQNTNKLKKRKAIPLHGTIYPKQSLQACFYQKGSSGSPKSGGDFFFRGDVFGIRQRLGLFLATH